MVRPKKEDKVKQLENQISEMKELLLKLTTSPVIQNQTIETTEDKIKEINEENEADKFVDIRPDKYIKVISLVNNVLVLSTEGNGKGKIFKFRGFGEVKNIVYKELSEIIHHQQRFAEQGVFYIMDKDVIRNHGLIENYNQFLTKEKMQNILEYNKEIIVELFKNAPEKQKDTIVSIILDKLNKGEDVDLNKVDIISRIYGKNIVDFVENKVEEE